MPYYSPTTATTLRRKSPPTCTLSLAHVSAASKFQPKSSFTVKNAELNLATMQVELQVDFSSVITVPVQVHVGDSTISTTSPSIRRSKSKKRIHLKRSEINVIPFPSSPSSPVSDSSSSSTHSSDSSNYSSSNYSSSASFTSSNSPPPSAPHVLLRSSHTNSSTQSPSSAAAKRARKGTVNASVSISTTAHSTLRTSFPRNTLPHAARFSSSASPTQTVSQLPPRPSSPTPHSPVQVPLQDKKDELFDPPPYSLPPPPYSPSPEVQASADKADNIARPLPTPTTTSPPLASRIPLPKPSPIPLTQTQPRRPRVSSSELKTILYLYRTIMYGVERRHRSETTRQKQPSSESTSPSTSPGRGSGNHFARFPLVEEDEDDDDQPIFTGPQRAARRLSKSPAAQAANFDVQDAFLAIRLRVFLKAQGVSEEDLAVHFDEENADDEMMEMSTSSASQVDPAPSMPAIVSPSPLPPIAIGGSDRQIRSSPPPLSPVPKEKDRPIPSAAYMIALLRMRNRQNPGQKLFGVVNDHGNANGAKKSGRGRLSGLRVCAWVAADEDGEQVVEEVEEDFDSSSVVDWYAGLGY